MSIPAFVRPRAGSIRTTRLPVTRALLLPIALTCLLAGLLPLVVAAIAASQGMLAGLKDPALGPALRLSMAVAAAVTMPGVLLGLAGAACARAAGKGAPALFACAVLVLVVPYPPLSVWPSPVITRDAMHALAGWGCALARSAALTLLLTARAVAGLQPGLQRAARSAGASPMRAWSHGVLAAVWKMAVLCVLAAFVAVLMQTRAATILAPHFDLADAWILPSALALCGCAAAAIAALLSVKTWVGRAVPPRPPVDYLASPQ